MVLGLGLDLVEIGRIAKACEKPHFRARIFTPAENARIDERGAQTAAGIFAAKEAVVKALGTGFRGFGPAAIEVRVDALGKPLCALSGKALERMQALGGETIHLSITHTGDMAAAVAILEGNWCILSPWTTCALRFCPVRAPRIRTISATCSSSRVRAAWRARR